MNKNGITLQQPEQYYGEVGRGGMVWNNVLGICPANEVAEAEGEGVIRRDKKGRWVIVAEEAIVGPDSNVKTVGGREAKIGDKYWTTRLFQKWLKKKRG